jgi:uncharacterized membrane protein YgcG
VGINTYLMMMTFRVWVIELAVTALNYFLLMQKVYEPRYGKLRAHQIGMSTRIVYIFVFAYFILFFAQRYTTLDTFYAGVFWLCSYWHSNGSGASSSGGRSGKYLKGGTSTRVSCGLMCWRPTCCLP